MADLLSSQDWTDIRSSLEDVKDTFFKFPVTFRHRTTRKLENFHENREDDLAFVDYALLALKVEEKTDKESKGTIMTKGAINDSEGYLYFSYQKLLAHAPPLIISGIPQMIINKDSVIFDGTEKTILGVNTVGPTESDFQLVKVTYKKQLQ